MMMMMMMAHRCNDNDDAMDVLELHYCPPNFVGYVATSDCAGYCKCKTTRTTSSDQQMSQQRRRRQRRRHMAKQIKSCIDGLLFNSTLQICTWAEDVHDSNMRQLKQREKQRGGEDKEGDLLASSNLVAAAAD